LEARGLAERRTDPNDRRARTIFLTEQGQETLERVRGLAAQLQREFFGTLTAEELRTAARAPAQARRLPGLSAYAEALGAAHCAGERSRRDPGGGGARAHRS